MAAVNKTESAMRDDESLPRQMNRMIAWLNRLRPGCVYRVAAQYGSQENQVFVIEVKVDGKVFQGIGPSRKRGRIMAAERALIHLNVLNALETPIPDQSLEPYCWDDFSADIADSTTALYYDFSCLYQDYTTEENPMELEDERETDFAYLEGMSTLAIIKELNPGAEFIELSEGRRKFVMGLTVNGMEFTGVGSSKQLAKARAARDALQYLYQMDFKMSEDGLPVYISGEDKWIRFKRMLEQKDYSSDLSVVKHTIQSLYEYFPELKLEFVDPKMKPGFMNFIVCNITIEGETFAGTGTNKKEAKTSAAESAMAAMLSNGAIAKIREARCERKKLKKKMMSEKETSQDWEQKIPILTAQGKLYERFPDATFELVAEMPFKKRTHAFVILLKVDGKTYTGVGRKKKLARAEAAEKALRELNMWTKEDKMAKHKALDDECDDEEYVSKQGGECGSTKEVRCFEGRRHGRTCGEYSDMDPFSDKELGMQVRTIQDSCTKTQQMYCARGNSSGGYGWSQGPDFSRRGSHWGPRPHGSKRRFTSPTHDEESPSKRSHVKCSTVTSNAQKLSSLSPQHSSSTSLDRSSLNSAVNIATSSQNKNSASFSKVNSSSNISSQKDWHSYGPTTDFRQNMESFGRCNTKNFVPRGRYNAHHAGSSRNPSATYHSEQSRFPSRYPFSQVTSDHLQAQYPQNSPRPRFPNPSTGFGHYADVNANQGNAEFGPVSSSAFGPNSFRPEFNVPNQNFSKNPGTGSGSYSYGQYSGTNMPKNMESSYQSMAYQSGISNPAMCSTSSVTRYGHQNTSSDAFRNANANYSAYNVPTTSGNATASSNYYGGYGTGDSYGYEQDTNANYDMGMYSSSGTNQTGANLNEVQNQIPPSYPYGGMQHW